jgi:hypothetical protein
MLLVFTKGKEMKCCWLYVPYQIKQLIRQGKEDVRDQESHQHAGPPVRAVQDQEVTVLGMGERDKRTEWFSSKERILLVKML